MKVYKYRNGKGAFDKNGNSFFERDVNILVENNIYAPIVMELNDPSENMVDDRILDLYKNTFSKNGLYDDWMKMKKMFLNLGIYSLSKSCNNELLWAYYASGHKGFAIEYDLDRLYTSFQYVDYEKMCYCLEVKYSNRMPKIKGLKHLWRLMNPETMLTIPLYLGNKSNNWKHEEEIRLVLEKKGLIEYDYRAVIGIYFGYKMDRGEMNYIMYKLRGRGIRYYKMILEDNYALTPVPIRDKYYDSPEYIVNNGGYDPRILTKEFLKDDYGYRAIVKEAVDIVCKKPLVRNALGVRVIKEHDFTKIEVVTSTTGIYFLKTFVFILNIAGGLILVEDIEREKRLGINIQVYTNF